MIYGINSEDFYLNIKNIPEKELLLDQWVN